MINLSSEEINLTSPYKVEWVGDNSFVFETRFGLRYNVGFVEDYTFRDRGVYQFYIVNLDNSHFIRDNNVKKTIQSVIEAFFSSEPTTMLYICDPSDNKQGVRDRLFRNWFKEYAFQGAYTLVNEKLKFDGVEYFASILLKNNHPEYSEIISSFKNFIEDLPNKIEQIQNN